MGISQCNFKFNLVIEKVDPLSKSVLDIDRFLLRDIYFVFRYQRAY